MTATACASGGRSPSRMDATVMSPLKRLALVALATAMGMAPFASPDYVGRHRAPVPAFSSPQDVLAHRDTIRLAEQEASAQRAYYAGKDNQS